MGEEAYLKQCDRLSDWNSDKFHWKYSLRYAISCEILTRSRF